MTIDRTDSETANDGKPEFTLDRLRVAAAGGYIVQVMPSAREDVISYLERTIPEAPHSAQMVRDGLGPFEMLQRALGDVGLGLLEEVEPRFHCQCSKDRALLIISALGRSEIEDMLKKDHGAELTCHFCNEKYRITEDELAPLLDEATE